MAKRPLRAWMREKLLNHAKEVIQPAAEKRVLDKAYGRAAELVTAVIEKKYPPRDMAVLERYGVTARFADPSVGIMCGGWFCDACDVVVGEEDYQPHDSDVAIGPAPRATDGKIGTPISQLSGQPGHPGFAEFCRIARSWGYE